MAQVAQSNKSTKGSQWSLNKSTKNSLSKKKKTKIS